MMRRTCDEALLTDAQRATAKALYTLKGIGRVEACLIAQKFPSLGALMSHFLRVPKAQACAAIATLQRQNGRKVGPAAANKLHRFFLCSDPDVPYMDRD
jgi:transposase